MAPSMTQNESTAHKTPPTIIPPTIGRVVWFWPDGGFTGTDGGKQPLDAHICYVHGPNMINIGGFDANGIPYAQLSVTLVQEGDPIPSGRFCTWMPYQTGQAKKHADDPKT